MRTDEGRRLGAVRGTRQIRGLGVLHCVKGKVALSSYHCNLMDELYQDWQAVEGPTKLVHSVKQPRTEILWVNYEISHLDKYKSGSKVEEWQVLQKSLI
jgi:hypothetical protein